MAWGPCLRVRAPTATAEHHAGPETEDAGFEDLERRKTTEGAASAHGEEDAIGHGLGLEMTPYITRNDTNVAGGGWRALTESRIGGTNVGPSRDENTSQVEVWSEAGTSAVFQHPDVCGCPKPRTDRSCDR